MLEIKEESKIAIATFRLKIQGVGIILKEIQTNFSRLFNKTKTRTRKIRNRIVLELVKRKDKYDVIPLIFKAFLKTLCILETVQVIEYKEIEKFRKHSSYMKLSTQKLPDIFW